MGKQGKIAFTRVIANLVWKTSSLAMPHQLCLFAFVGTSNKANRMAKTTFFDKTKNPKLCTVAATICIICRAASLGQNSGHPLDICASSNPSIPFPIYHLCHSISFLHLIAYTPMTSPLFIPTFWHGPPSQFMSRPQSLHCVNFLNSSIQICLCWRSSALLFFMYLQKTSILCSATCGPSCFTSIAFCPPQVVSTFPMEPHRAISMPIF